MDGAVAETQRDVSARLRELLSPKSIVLVGASDNSGWSGGSFANYEQIGFAGALHLVNRNGGEVHGRHAFTSCAEIGEPVDLALMLVGAAGLPAALADAAAAGVRSASCSPPASARQVSRACARRRSSSNAAASWTCCVSARTASGSSTSSTVRRPGRGS